MAETCSACKNGSQEALPFSMAFQPIVDVDNQCVFAYEALVRGMHNESAASILTQVNEENRYSFDQACRVRAITLASQLGLPQTGARLSINFMPGAVYSPAACIQLTLRTARQLNFPLDRLIFEITEGEQVQDPGHLSAIATEYRRHGLQIALDDFGAGYSHLNLLSDLATDILKLDMALTRNLHRRPRAQHIVRSIARLCHDLGTELIAEGIESVEEYQATRDCGVHLIQGYLLARPAFQALPIFALPNEHTTAHPQPAWQDKGLFPMLTNLPA